MNYTVLLIGLTYFDPQPGGEKRALMPDGRMPPANTDPHIPSISIRSADLVSHSGWDAAKVKTDPPPKDAKDPQDPNAQTEFFFDDAPSFIAFPAGARLSSSAPSLNSRDLDNGVIHFKDIDSKFELSTTPDWVASMWIEEGTIEALRIPNSPTDGTAQIFARWTMNDRGPASNVTITLTDKTTSKIRTIVVKDGSEIAVVNASRLHMLPGDHFAIYEKLAVTGVTLRAPATHRVLPELRSNHPVFTHPAAASGKIACSPGDPAPPAGAR